MKIITFINFFILLVACSELPEIELVYVKGGEAMIGSDQEDAEIDEALYYTNISDFYIGKYEITQSQWVSVMGYNPSAFKGSERPVESVCYEEVLIFIDRLNKKSGKRYRLPTEQEWEYAAKGGEKLCDFKFSGSDNIIDVGWSSLDGVHETAKVGSKNPNSIGIFDMTGNVHEWCSGQYERKYYDRDTSLNNKYLLSEIRLFRGGSFSSTPEYCRITNRNYNHTLVASPSLGFRLALDVN